MKLFHEVLVAYGANVNKVNKKGETPLDCIINFHFSLREKYRIFLVSKGARYGREIKEN